MNDFYAAPAEKDVVRATVQHQCYTSGPHIQASETDT